MSQSLLDDIAPLADSLAKEMVDKSDFVKEMVDKWSIKPNLADKLGDILVFLADKEETNTGIVNPSPDKLTMSVWTGNDVLWKIFVVL